MPAFSSIYELVSWLAAELTAYDDGEVWADGREYSLHKNLRPHKERIRYLLTVWAPDNYHPAYKSVSKSKHVKEFLS